jgi:hypothetical protein
VKTASCWNDLRSFGIIPLTGKACGLKFRSLFDLLRERFEARGYRELGFGTHPPRTEPQPDNSYALIVAASRESLDWFDALIDEVSVGGSPRSVVGADRQRSLLSGWAGGTFASPGLLLWSNQP